MSTKRNHDHILMANTSTGGYALICSHCGQVYVPSLPISIDMFLQVSRQFGKEHSGCQVPQSGRLDTDALLRKAAIRHLVNVEQTA